MSFEVFAHPITVFGIPTVMTVGSAIAVFIAALGFAIVLRRQDMVAIPRRPGQRSSLLILLVFSQLMAAAILLF